MNDVVSIAHTNSGIRCIVMPGVRMFRMVTRKFIAPRIDELPRMMTPTNHRLWPKGPRALSGGDEGQPPAAAPPAKFLGGLGEKNPDRISSPPRTVTPHTHALFFSHSQYPPP